MPTLEVTAAPGAGRQAKASGYTTPKAAPAWATGRWERTGRMARRIGILGGSFNPAHRGHLDLSLAAIHRLGLDQVWWMVSPQNPLKPAYGMAPFAERLASARAMARDKRIKVTDIEARLRTRYTAETLAKLLRRAKDERFVWLMGADNLAQMDEWKNWQQIFHLLPIAVFARPSYSFVALAAKAARRFARDRLREDGGRSLVTAKPPAWLFVHGRLNPISATEIRKRRSPARRSTAATTKG
jgi:nicotinate-nucleotide adenylyltransferase